MREIVRKKEISHFMDSSYLKKQLIGEVQEAIIVKELNVELLKHLSYTARVYHASNSYHRFCETDRKDPNPTE